MQAPSGYFACGISDLHYFDPRCKALTPTSHLTARLFFPTAHASNDKHSWFHCSWLTSWYSARGYACFPFTFKDGFVISVLRSLVTLFVALIGYSVRLPGRWNAPHVISSKDLSSPRPLGHSRWSWRWRSPSMVNNGKLPLVIFSHGLAGQRGTYSAICLELASLGFLVVAIEHADGTASVAELSGPPAKMNWDPSPRELPGDAKGRWRWYGGLGEHVKVGRPRWRLEEVKTALRIIRELNSGISVEGLHISACPDANLDRWIASRIDMESVFTIGHSYGGATASWASCLPGIAGGVALDPWWEALPADAALLTRSEGKRAPLLVIGSEEWNVPLPSDGTSSSSQGTSPSSIKMSCGYERREIIMSVASEASGCLRIVPRHSNHHSFGDIMLLMEQRGVMAVAGCLNFQRPEISPGEMHGRIVLIIELFLKDVIACKGREVLTDGCMKRYRDLLGDERIFEIVLSAASTKEPTINLTVDAT